MSVWPSWWGRNLNSDDVLATLTDLFTRHGPPAYIRSDNGPELTAKLVRDWLGELGVKTLFIEQWRREYNTVRPHSSLGYRPPAPEGLKPDPIYLDLPVLQGPPAGRECVQV